LITWPAQPAPSTSPLLPDLPTMAEAGLPGVDAALMFGLVAPAATPAAILKTLTDAAAACVRADPLRARLGYRPIGSTAEEFRARIAADIAKWSRIVEAAGIKPN
jgi:tripartite-type tricarboxylate transporter receptor subunit TctC